MDRRFRSIVAAQYQLESGYVLRRTPTDFSGTESDLTYELAVPGSRLRAKRLSSDAFVLLTAFAEPAFILDAIEAFARVACVSTTDVFDEAGGFILGLIDAGYLVKSGQQVQKRRSLLDDKGWTQASGLELTELIQDFGDYSVLRGRLRDMLVIVKAGRWAERRSSPLRSLVREARVLRALAGPTFPRLVGAGRHDGVFWFAASLRPGRTLKSFMTSSTHPLVLADRLRLCVSITKAYVALHEEGWLHGDTSDSNIMVDDSFNVSLVDFGMASRLPGHSFSRGHETLSDPEAARAHLNGEPCPPYDEQAELYAVAVVLYSVVTGGTYLPFGHERDRVFAQIAFDPAIPFAFWGVTEIDEIEDVLLSALAKDPKARPPFLDWCERFRSGVANNRRSEPSRPRLHERTWLDAFTRLAPQDWLGRFGNCHSVGGGIAGIGAVLVREGALSASPLATEWGRLYLEYALTITEPPKGLARDNDSVESGGVSLVYSTLGVVVELAEVGADLGDENLISRMVAQAIPLLAEKADNIDLYLGGAGQLTAAARLLNSAEAVPSTDTQALRHAGARLESRVFSEVRDRDLDAYEHLGFAHGLAGALFALMRWRLAVGRPLELAVEARTAELMQRLDRTPSTFGWPISRGSNEKWLGLCNGVAGFLLMLSSREELVGDGLYGRQMEDMVDVLRKTPGSYDDSICCGRSGISLVLSEVTGGDVLSPQNISRVQTTALDLFKGELGKRLVQMHGPGRQFGLPLFGPRRTKIVEGSGRTSFGPLR